MAMDAALPLATAQEPLKPLGSYSYGLPRRAGSGQCQAPLNIVLSVARWP